MENKSKSLNHLDKSSIQKICSAQVILDLATAVKELIENSVDAGATQIGIDFILIMESSLTFSEIQIKNYGIDSVEVTDNGSGIQEEDYQKISINPSL